MSKLKRGEIRRVPVAELKESAFSVSVYDPEPPPDLKESIKANGVLQRPLVDKDLTIRDGHRRVRTCKAVGITEIEVEVVDTKDPDRLTLELNRQRVKTLTERLREGEEFAKRIRPLARARQRTQAPENSEKNSAKARVHVREQLEKFMGFSHDTYRKAQLIKEHRPDLLLKVDEGTESIHGAYRETMKSLPPMLPKSPRPNPLDLEQYRVMYAVGALLARTVKSQFGQSKFGFRWVKVGLLDALGKDAVPKVDVDAHAAAAVALFPLLADSKLPEAPIKALASAGGGEAALAELNLEEPTQPPVEATDADPEDEPRSFELKPSRRRRVWA